MNAPPIRFVDIPWREKTLKQKVLFTLWLPIAIVVVLIVSLGMLAAGIERLYNESYLLGAIYIGMQIVMWFMIITLNEM